MSNDEHMRASIDVEDGIIITKTAVQHCDESNISLFENLEMQRLGLPTQFSSAKTKRAKYRRKNRQKRQQHHHDRIFHNKTNHNNHHLTHHSYNQFHVVNNDFDFLPPPKRADLIQSSLNTMREKIAAAITQQELDNDIDEMVDEFPSMILSTSSYDNHDDLSDTAMTSLTECADEECKAAVVEAEMVSPESSALESSAEEGDEESEFSNDDVNLKAKQVKNPSNQKQKKKLRMHIYWRQRFILFQRFNEGVKMDHESWYSVTPEAIAQHIAQRVEQTFLQQHPAQKFIAMDPFCGAGGNIIQFALRPSIEKVYAIDIDPKKIEMAKHNARIYECEHKIEFIIGDFFQITKHSNFRDLIDFCFFSPPWGGPDYIKKKKYSLHHMEPNGFEICDHASRYLTKNLIMLVPRNFDESELKLLSGMVYKTEPNRPSQQFRMVELEKNMIFNKIKTMTVYFGDTIRDQSQTPKKIFYE